MGLRGPIGRFDDPAEVDIITLVPRWLLRWLLDAPMDSQDAY